MEMFEMFVHNWQVRTSSQGHPLPMRVFCGFGFGVCKKWCNQFKTNCGSALSVDGTLYLRVQLYSGRG